MMHSTEAVLLLAWRGIKPFISCVCFPSKLIASKARLSLLLQTNSFPRRRIDPRTNLRQQLPRKRISLISIFTVKRFDRSEESERRHLSRSASAFIDNIVDLWQKKKHPLMIVCWMSLSRRYDRTSTNR